MKRREKMVTSECSTLLAKLSYTSDRLTISINSMSGHIEACIFCSVLIYPFSVFLNGWANFGPHASYGPASTTQWAILVKNCGL